MSAYSVVDLSTIIHRSGARTIPKRGGLAKMNVKGEEDIVAWTGGIILGADGSLATLKTYVSWDPSKEHNGTKGAYVFLNPPPFFDPSRTCDPTIDIPLMQPPHPMMYRPLTLKAQERKATTCSTWIYAKKFNGIDGKEVNVSMDDYIRIVWKHIFEHGMGDECAFFYNGEVYNIIFNYYGLSKALCDKFLMDSKVDNDEYSTTNLGYIHDFLLDSLDDSLLADVKKDLSVEQQANGIDAWNAIMKRMWKHNYFTIEKCREELKSLSLKSFPGENVKELLAAAEPQMTRLERCGDINSKDVMTLLVALEDSSEERFRNWISNDVVRPLTDSLNAHLGPPSTFRKFDDFKTLSKKISAKYEELLSEHRYGPALDTPSIADQPVIKGMKAGVNEKNQLEQVSIHKRSRSGTSHGGSSGSWFKHNWAADAFLQTWDGGIQISCMSTSGSWRTGQKGQPNRTSSPPVLVFHLQTLVVSCG